MKYYFIQFVYILNFFESLNSKSTQMLRPQNGKLAEFCETKKNTFQILKCM